MLSIFSHDDSEVYKEIGSKNLDSLVTIDSDTESPNKNLILEPRSDLSTSYEVLSPRKRRMKQREATIKKLMFLISSPFPYMILLLLLAMIVMIFVDVMSISGLVCITAVIMVRL
jgi:hypothetical protein